MDAAILYIMDPLCGWCYGFSPVVQRVQEEYPQFQYRVITGGMMTGDRVQPFAAMSGYILKAYHRVEELTGVKFGEPYLDLMREGTELSDSEKPCQAIHAFQQVKPAKGISFAHAVQLKSFKEGKSLNNDETYAELASEFDIHPTAFLAQVAAEDNKYGTVQDWQWCKAAGITGFPCLVLQAKDQYYMIAQGFRPFEDVKEVIEQLKAMIEERI